MFILIHFGNGFSRLKLLSETWQSCRLWCL